MQTIVDSNFGKNFSYGTVNLLNGIKIDFPRIVVFIEKLAWKYGHLVINMKEVVQTMILTEVFQGEYVGEPIEGNLGKTKN